VIVFRGIVKSNAEFCQRHDVHPAAAHDHLRGEEDAVPIGRVGGREGERE